MLPRSSHESVCLNQGPSEGPSGPRDQNGPGQRVKRLMRPNVSLCFMQHQVAKEYHDRGPRINLTFRSLHPEPADLQ